MSSKSGARRAFGSVLFAWVVSVSACTGNTATTDTGARVDGDGTDAVRDVIDAGSPSDTSVDDPGSMDGSTVVDAMDALSDSVAPIDGGPLDTGSTGDGSGDGTTADGTPGDAGSADAGPSPCERACDHV